MWKWESDSGDAFNNFSDEHCRLLERAFLSGQARLEMPERRWIFDLQRMTQTKIGGSSRMIKRFAESSSSSAAAAPWQPGCQPPQHHSA
jgi:hypothetical protein